MVGLLQVPDSGVGIHRRFGSRPRAKSGEESLEEETKGDN